MTNPSGRCGCGAPIICRRPPQRRHKRRRLGDGTAAKLRAERPNHVWALDFSSTRPLLGGASSCSTSSTSTPAKRSPSGSITASTPTAVVDVVEAIAAVRGAPGHLRMDNGPEFVADALRDWCELSGTATAYIEPGAPWENGHIESFNGRLRDECLNIEDFANLLEARVVIEDWRHDYNHYRPHRSLGGLTPAAYAANHKQTHPTITTNQHP